MNSLKLYFVFSLIPPTRLFEAKAVMLRKSGARVGRNVRVVSSARFYLTGTLSIGDDTWIGHEALVVGGVTVGATSLVAAGSLVREDVPARAVVAGVPAKLVRSVAAKVSG